METHNVMILSVAILLFGLAACHKDTMQPNPSNHAASEYFPNTVGDYWEYEVYDSSDVRDHPNLPRQYTVKVTITGTKKLADGKDALVWEYQYPDTTKEVFIRTYPDSVRIYGTQSLTDPRSILFGEIYVLPFVENKNWQGKLLYIDSFYVSELQNLTTSYGTYNNCFDIYRHYLGPNLEFKDHYWFKPNAGFVKIYYHQYNLGPTLIQIWQLKHYVLK